MKPTPKADNPSETDAKDAKDDVKADAAPSDKQSSIVDRVKAIDVTSLDRLVAIRQEQKRVDDYRARAEEKKSAVSEMVYARVLEDYKKRSASLEEQSTPLRAQARDEYKKLKALIDEVKLTDQRTRLQKDELEFRHSVGEFSDEHLADKLKEPVRILEACQADQAAVDASKARFIEALGSEEALEEPVLAEAVTARVAESSARSATPPGSPIPPEKGTTVPRKSAEVQAAANSATPPGGAPYPELAGTGGTARNAATGKGATARTAVPAETPPVKTTVLLTAAVLTSDAAAGRNEFLLGPLNEIGRAEENQIQIASSNLSRKHAVIRAVPGGFSITDLGSQNGTYVNGERVTEKRLADGDTIELGSVRFVFRTPWPVTSHGMSVGAGARPGNR
jgi:hypothetical protein